MLATQPEQKWLTAQEAADYLRISISTLYAWIARGVVKRYTARGSRVVRFSRNQLEGVLRHRDG